MRTSPAPLPPPLVRFSRHPITWVRNKAELLLAALILAHIGTLIVVALYYLVFEINPTMTSWWHHTVSDSTLRHNLRSVGEGLLGGFLAQQVVWNHYKKALNKKPTKLDHAEMALRIPNAHDTRGLSLGEVVVAPVFAILYAVPGFIAGYVIVRWAHSTPHHVAHASAAAHGQATSVWNRTKTLWTQDWPQKAMGLGASFFFGRRPMRGVFDDVQLWFAERRVAATKKAVHWYHPPTFKARYNSVASEGADVAVHHGGGSGSGVASVRAPAHPSGAKRRAQVLGWKRVVGLQSARHPVSSCRFKRKSQFQANSRFERPRPLVALVGTGSMVTGHPPRSLLDQPSAHTGGRRRQASARHRRTQGSCSGTRPCGRERPLEGDAAHARVAGCAGWFGGSLREVEVGQSLLSWLIHNPQNPQPANSADRRGRWPIAPSHRLFTVMGNRFRRVGQGFSPGTRRLRW